jgi:hypothetical protein
VTVIEPIDVGVPSGPETRDARRAAGEEQSIASVVESLVAAFPAVPEPCIRDCVQRICAGFADAPIRTYIPILVARQARAALTDECPGRCLAVRGRGGAAACLRRHTGLSRCDPGAR